MASRTEGRIRVRGIAAAIGAVAGMAIALGGCGDDNGTAETAPPQKTENVREEPTSSGGGPAKVFRADTGTLQAVVFDESGYALYRFDKDKGPTSTCYGACAKQWPPLLTEGTPIAYAVIPQKLGTTERKDGTTQVTYFSHPLYGFVGNEKFPTGKIPGNGVKAFGGTWHAMHRTGQDVKQQGA
jgi:predicted lipoprotein with Yx(FWY)xxD motif